MLPLSLVLPEQWLFGLVMITKKREGEKRGREEREEKGGREGEKRGRDERIENRGGERKGFANSQVNTSFFLQYQPDGPIQLKS